MFMDSLDKKSAEDEVQAAVESATPVPGSFDQACAWASAAAFNAAQNGKMKQTMYYNAGGSDDASVSGELANVLAFSETMCKMMCQSVPVEGGIIRVVLPDVGRASLVKTKWEANSDDGELPDNLLIDYLPTTMSSTVAGASSALANSAYVELLDAEVLVILAPRQQECASILALIEGMTKLGKNIPMIMVNAQLRAGEGGIVAKQARKLLQQATNTFHLAQYVPDSDDPMMSAGVVARVWPRPYSTWEDFPEDPDSNDGYFLMDLGERPPAPETVFSLLEASRDARSVLIKKAKDAMAPRVRTK